MTIQDVKSMLDYYASTEFLDEFEAATPEQRIALRHDVRDVCSQVEAMMATVSSVPEPVMLSFA